MAAVTKTKVECSVIRDLGEIILTLVHMPESGRIETRIYMSDDEAKHLALELYRLSDGGDINKKA